jgi:YidC/Oxa1 family membrane protein insertase
MDKNTIIGLLLLFGLFVGYSFYNSSKIKKTQEEQAKEMAEQVAKQPKGDSLTKQLPAASSLPDSNVVEQADSNVNAATPAMKELFPVVESDDNSAYQVETDLAKYSISKKGGYVSRIELKNIYHYTPKDSVKQPLVLFENDENTIDISLMLNDQSVIHSKDYMFISNIEDTLFVNEKGKKTLSLRLHPINKDTNGTTCETLDKDSYIEYLYTFSADNYRFEFDINFVNMKDYLYPNNHTFTIDWNANLMGMEKNYLYERNITSLFYMDNLSEVANLKERDSDKKDFSTPLKWVSFKQQFFTSVIIADSANFSTGLLAVTAPPKEELKLLKQMSADLDFEIADLDNGGFDLSFYYGPNQYKLLNKYDLNLERLVPLGWGFFLLQWINRFAVIPVFNWLETYGLNYGIIILILTIFLKIILLPIAYKTYLSSARMRVLKPEIDEINARYPKPDDMGKKQQVTMALYKSAGVNPMSGCLPMLFQMPILIAMYRFFPAAYELRQQSFLWAEDLSAYDSVANLGFSIPFYGDHVSLFTLLMTAATIIYTWLNNKLMAPGGNDQSQKMMKVMMYIMPIMFLGMFNSFASGLTYYYLLVNLFTFLQMWIFRMAVNENNLHDKIKLNMQKPVKKSKWQIKMEELAKQQTQLQKARK